MWQRTNHPALRRVRTEGGQGMVEYLLIVGIATIVLFVPSPLTNNMAPADYIALAVRAFFRGYSFLVSIF